MAAHLTGANSGSTAGVLCMVQVRQHGHTAAWGLRMVRYHGLGSTVQRPRGRHHSLQNAKRESSAREHGMRSGNLLATLLIVSQEQHLFWMSVVEGYSDSSM